MEKDKKLPFITGILISALFFSSIGFFLGYYRYSSQIAKERIAREQEEQLLNSLLEAQENSIYKANKDTEKSVTSNKDIISKDTTVIYQVVYTQCEDAIEEIGKADLDLVGLNEDGLKEYIRKSQWDWEMKSFSKEKIVLSRRENRVCPNHYLVSVNKGFIAVYKYDEEGKKNLVDQTEIPINVLPTIDQEKLQKGILVETLEEVYQLLEDYSS